MNKLDPTAAPNLPVTPISFGQQHFDLLNNILRLYFNRLDGVLRNLLNVRGGRYIDFPYAAVQRTTNVTATAANTAYQVTFDTNDYLNGCTNDGTDGIHVDQDGIYNYQFSIQFENSDTSIHEATVWLKKNGVNESGTATIISVPNKHGGVNGYGVLAANFYVSLVAGDHIELWWATTNTSLIMESYAASASPYSRPSIPSVVATLSFVSNTNA